MASELINTVLQAENEMKKTEKMAKIVADKAISDAKIQANIIFDSTVEQATNTANLILSEAEVSADGIKRQAEKLAALREKKSISNTEKKYAAAINAVIKFIK